jgi:hypothetical protein
LALMNNIFRGSCAIYVYSEEHEIFRDVDC